MSEDRQAAIATWFAAHDAYHKASDVYNARVRYVRAKQERDSGALVMNCHQEYKALNDSQRAALRADEVLYQRLVETGGAGGVP